MLRNLPDALRYQFLDFEFSDDGIPVARDTKLAGESKRFGRLVFEAESGGTLNIHRFQDIVWEVDKPENQGMKAVFVLHLGGRKSPS